MIRIEGISKSFAGVHALDSVSLELFPGEILGLIGENGAGKSTLMKIIGGVHQPDSGSVLVSGEKQIFNSPRDALAAGIRVIFQELTCLENLTVAGNIFLGAEKQKGFFLNNKEMETVAVSILKRIGLDVSPADIVSNLSIAQKQLLEIARALAFEVKVLILDEPTSSLTLEESRRLFTLVRELQQSGVSIIYISHRLDELKELADRVVGLRDGKNAGELRKDEITHDAMVKMMVGRKVYPSKRSVATTTGSLLLDLSNIQTIKFPNSAISFGIHAGEIVGMAGLVGSGRTELANAVYGLEEYSGAISLNGEKVKIRCPQDSIRKGIYLVPEDRKAAGVVLEHSVKENVSLPNLPQLSRGPFVKKDQERVYAQNAVEMLHIKTPSVDLPVGNLSGGNQQKVVLSKWLKMNPKVLIVDEPTRGVDVGAKAEIYAELRALAQSGIGVWMISSDMEEVLQLSDRIIVLHEGRITGELSGETATEENVMRLAVGGAL